jgi:hypothetical protein
MAEIRLTLELALESRARHGVQVDGTCRLCPQSRFPCEFFTRAQRVVVALTEDEASGFVLGDEYIRALPMIGPDWLEGRS